MGCNARSSWIYFLLGARLQMSTSAAQMTFWAFAAVMGISLSYIFIVFTGVSIVRVFLITSCTFAAMTSMAMQLKEI